MTEYTPEETVTENYGNVSEAWKEKFALLEKIGADDKFIYQAMQTPEYKALGFKQKRKISFNFLGFFFDWIYYFFKKMWLKGAFILGVTLLFSCLLTIVEMIAGFYIPGPVYWIPTAVICAQFANYDYYRKVVHQEEMWPGIPSIFSKPWGAIGFPAVGLALLLGISFAGFNSLPYTDDEILDDVSGVWRASDNTIIEVATNQQLKTITIDNRKIPVSVSSIDHENNIVNLNVEMQNGSDVIWSIRQFYDDNFSFTIDLTLHDGSLYELGFVREL